MTIFESYKLIEYNSLFEIPIYRIDPDAFINELQKYLDKTCQPITSFEEYFPKNAKEMYDSHRYQYELHIGYPWKFNEIIGWVLLNIDREIFSGELFYKKGKRIYKGSKSKITYRGEAFRFNIEDGITDLEIYSRIILKLKGLSKKSITRGRYIDTNRFETVGKFVNWKKLFEDISK